MKTRVRTIYLIFFLGAAAGSGAIAQENPNRPDHSAWDAMLGTYVHANGTVDYPGFSRDRSRLDAYLAALVKRAPDSSWGRSRKLAYFINLYNALTVRLILDHYPLGSIRDLPDPWGRELITLGGRGYSLDDIEHRVLRRMGEPRIHFAINCASVSCPVLQPHAFTEERLEAQLEEATRAFINDPARNSFSPDSTRLSLLFKWYRDDFEAASGSLPAYLNPYLAIPLPPDSKIRFLPYDWNLNQKR